MFLFKKNDVDYTVNTHNHHQMKKTRNGIHISKISKYLKAWESYMPNDITNIDLKDWKEQHAEAIGTMPQMMQDLISIDVTYPGCYFAKICRQEKLLSSEDEIDSELFRLGRYALQNGAKQWEFVMNEIERLRSLK